MLDKDGIKNSFSQAAKTYDDHALLQKIVGERLIERLGLLKTSPRRILEIGCGTGLQTRLLSQRYPKADIVAIDFAPGMIDIAKANLPQKWYKKKRISFECVDCEALPYQDNDFDLVVSCSTFQWVADLRGTFREIQRVLETDGALFFTSFGPDTLHELKQSFRNIDEQPHVNDFIDMHHIGDLLLSLQFLTPVVDMELLSLTYRQPMNLIKDLKNTGACNQHSARSQGLKTRHFMTALLQEYEKFVLADGQYPATFEVIYGHAFNPKSKIQADIPLTVTT